MTEKNNGVTSVRMVGLIVEVVQLDRSCLSEDKVKMLVNSYIYANKFSRKKLLITEFDDPNLTEHVESIRFDIQNNLVDLAPSQILANSDFDVLISVFKLCRDGPEIEEICADDNNEEMVKGAVHWKLPSMDLQDIWESLVYNTDIKSELMSYIDTCLYLGERSVRSNVISCNRLVLLQGPPGTGKTSLCKAVAQKLAIRLMIDNRYRHGQLIEVNSHSLFSKWFSESGKLVQNMFSMIYDLCSDPEAFVLVLIDEVESLSTSRAKAGSEPGDAVRVVNALLTQLDRLRHLPNVVVLTTSNLSNLLDPAFIDRSDLQLFVGLPNEVAIYNIYQSCISELIQTSIVSIVSNDCELWERLVDVAAANQGDSNPLMAVARLSVGLSGRKLRKMPLLALSSFRPIPHSLALSDFINALRDAVSKTVSIEHRMNL